MTIIIPNKNEKNVNLVTYRARMLFPKAQIIVSDDYIGKGKGWALRRGLELAKDLPFIFLDGDLDIDPHEIDKLIPYRHQYDIVVGRKGLPLSWKRRFITRLSRLYIKWLFGITVDTQTGIKLFNYKPEFNTDGWAYDIEILYKAKKSGKTMIEAPVEATVSDSKTVKDLWTTFVDSLKIRFSPL